MRQILRRSVLKLNRNSLKLASMSPALLGSHFKIQNNLLNKQIYCAGSAIDIHRNISKSVFQGPGFYMQQLFTGCLAVYSYYIESNGEAFLIDPMNQIEKYQEILKTRKSTLKGVFLSHYHADYIAGHVELQKKYDCKIIMGPNALKTHWLTVGKDNEEFKLGEIKLKLIHTPGHTQESSCFLLVNSQNKQQALFTGDTIFIGEVGRPDLAVKTSLTKQDLAEMLYHSIQKVKKLDGNIRIYPGHGAGSSCGKNISEGDFCTLEKQKANNYAFNIPDINAFTKKVLDQMPVAPRYFGHDASLNKFVPFDYEYIQDVVMNKLSSSQLPRLVERDGAIIIDVRGKDELQKGMIKGAMAFDFDGAFANWVGTLMSPKSYYIIYGSQEYAKQSIKRMLRIGYTNIAGYCFDPIDVVSKQMETYIPNLIVEIKSKNPKFLDVRKPSQWKAGHVQNAENFELSNLPDEYKKLDQNTQYIVYCKSGYRSRIAYSFLKSKGYKVTSFVTSYQNIQKSGFKIVQ